MTGKPVTEAAQATTEALQRHVLAAVPADLSADPPDPAGVVEAVAPPLALLRMAVKSETVAVPIEYVREVLELTRVTPLPQTPAFVRGLMNLRGTVIPVFDLGVRLGLGPAEITRRTSIVVVEPQGGARVSAERSVQAPRAVLQMVGILVDAVHEVFDTTDLGQEAPPTWGTRIPANLLSSMVRSQGEAVSVLALEQVLHQEQLAKLMEQHLAESLAITAKSPSASAFA
jgi:purine-binding chemotaxis protein CheW